MVEVANIREQCSWIHKDMQEATLKAVILARAAIAKSALGLDRFLMPQKSPVFTSKVGLSENFFFIFNPLSL